jgi:hypothetical protein
MLINKLFIIHLSQWFNIEILLTNRIQLRLGLIEEVSRLNNHSLTFIKVRHQKS